MLNIFGNSALGLLEFTLAALAPFLLGYYFGKQNKKVKA